MSSCSHPVIYQGLCAACGQDVSSLPAAQPASSSTAASRAGVGSHAIVLGGAHKTIHLSSQALQERTRSNTLELLQARKMLCVLDLDHTLLHATSDPRVHSFVGKEEDLHKFTLGAPPNVKTHYVKLRPGLRRFLEETAKLFDMHVYTMGARAYADAVVPIVDSTHRFIKHRVVSRDESTTPGSDVHITNVAKSLKRMYPCDEGLICIVDDRTDVWAANARNVVRAFEFLYFSGRGEMNSRPGEHHSQDAALPIFPYQFATHPHPDNVLHSVTSVLQAVHQLFYWQVDQALQPTNPGDKPSPMSDVLPLSAAMSIPRLITLVKQTTLAGCVLVFSGVFPTVKTKDGSNIGRSGAQQAEAWVQATAFGAICLEDFPGREDTKANGNANGSVSGGLESPEDDVVPVFGQSDALSAPKKVTHVVAARDGSAKLHYAASLPPADRPHLVHVSWLWHSLAHFQRGDEKLFPLWSDKSAPSAQAAQQQQRSLSPQPLMQPEPANGLAPSASATSSSSVPHTGVTTTSSESNVAVESVESTPSVPNAQSSRAVIDLSDSPAPASSSSAAPAASTASTMVTTTVGGLRRRIPKKVALAATAAAVPTPMDIDTPAATISSSSAVVAPTPVVAASSVPADLRYALHLVHHSARPITAEELVQRVQQHLASKEDAARASDAVADLTAAREMILASELRKRRKSDPSMRRGRKSVSFSDTPLGPTNPNYDNEPHTQGDAAAPVAASSSSSASASLKRKAHVPLDDVDRLHKRPTTQRSHDSTADVARDEEDGDVTMVDPLHDDEEPFAISSEELYAQPDVMDQDNGDDPFAVDDCFEDGMEYGDSGGGDDN